MVSIPFASMTWCSFAIRTSNISTSRNAAIIAFLTGRSNAERCLFRWNLLPKGGEILIILCQDAVFSFRHVLQHFLERAWEHPLLDTLDSLKYNLDYPIRGPVGGLWRSGSAPQSH